MSLQLGEEEDMDIDIEELNTEIFPSSSASKGGTSGACSSRAIKNRYEIAREIKMASNTKAKNVKSFPKNLKNVNSGRKIIVDNPTPEMINIMVNNAIKYLVRNSTGASFENIRKHLEDNYEISTKDLKSCLKEALKEGVDIGLFEEVNGVYFHKEKAKDYAKTKALGDVSLHENISFEKKVETPLPTREMITMMIKYSIKNTKHTYGASFEEINKQLKDKYRVNTDLYRHCLKQILEDCVDDGVLEKIKRASSVERFKIKQPENIAKRSSRKI